MRTLAVLFLLLGCFGVAEAQTTSIENALVTPNGGTASSKLGGILGRTINVLDYGAKCDGATDDSAAINSAVNYARNLPLGGFNSQPALIVFPKLQRCLIRSTLNFTSIKERGFQITGGYIECKVVGGPCIDALNTRALHWTDLTIISQASGPTYGIQIGRIDATTADDNQFDKVTIVGDFSVAPFYNFASESCVFLNIYFKNTNGGTGTYGLIQDGYNKFNITSAFVSQTNPVNSTQAFTFNENLFLGGTIGARGAGIGIFLAGTGRHRFSRTYSCVGCDGFSGGVTANVELYFLVNDSADNNNMLDADIHFETNPLYTFLLTGSATAPVIRALRYADQANQAQDFVFKIDSSSSIGSVQVQNFDIQISKFSFAPPLVQTQSQWTFTGNIFLSSSALFPFTQTRFKGCAYLAGNVVNCSLSSVQIQSDRRVSEAVDFPLALPSGAGIQYDNLGAAGSVNFTLGAPTVVGQKLGFCVEVAQPLLVTADATSTISIGTSGSAAGGNVTSSAVGSCLQLEATTLTTWRALASTGSWAVH